VLVLLVSIIVFEVGMGLAHVLQDAGLLFVALVGGCSAAAFLIVGPAARWRCVTCEPANGREEAVFELLEQQGYSAPQRMAVHPDYQAAFAKVDAGGGGHPAPANPPGSQTGALTLDDETGALTLDTHKMLPGASLKRAG
jgi:hypothetical protein